ncbi:hypothetical protein F8S12_06125 [Nostoc sp. WHI]|nr:hypothetical protein [Nostoc sp. WHI]
MRSLRCDRNDKCLTKHDIKNSLMELKASLMELKDSLMKFKDSLMELKDSLMKIKAPLMEFKASLMELKDSSEFNYLLPRVLFIKPTLYIICLGTAANGVNS